MRSLLEPASGRPESNTLTGLRICVALWALICATLPAVGDGANAAKRPFTVRDSIESTRILSISGHARAHRSDPVALFSPDGNHFVVRTRRGDVTTDSNIEQILLWNTREIFSRSEAPDRKRVNVPTVLVEKNFHDDWGSISGVRWLDNQTLGFIAQGDNGRLQAFAVNIDSKALTQLTRSKTDVVSFTTAADRTVYFAKQETSATVQIVNDRPFFEVAFADDPRGAAIELLHTRNNTGDAVRIAAPAIRVNRKDIWISPSGRYAVTLAPSTDAPKKWSRYKVFRQDRNYASVISSDPTSWLLSSRVRYQLIDLERNVARPLLDAPAGFLTNAPTPPAVFWLKNEQSVVISNTFLPLDGSHDQEHSEAPAIAEVDLRSGYAQPIAWIPWVTESEWKAGKRPQNPILDVRWDAGRQAVTLERRLAPNRTAPDTYVKSGSRWVPAAPPMRNQSPTIEIRQGLNARPKLYIRSAALDESRELFDPAPQLDTLSFGQVEAIAWKDEYGRTWRAGLVYPVGYQKGERYPLVVQTHGFDPNEFLIDGPSGATTSFAAQSFANAGMLVLQVNESRGVTNDESESERVADGILAGIQMLADRGIVDRENIGLVAWSRTGLHALTLLAEHPTLLAAVSISDSVQFGITQVMLSANNSDAIAETARMTGGLPTDIGFAQWFARNPLYRIARSSAAVRIESIGELYSMWETYALLRFAGRPVEHVFFPQGSHNLLKPSERLASQEGNVDWFRFWLQDYEDPQPEKAEQYLRWRRLRELRSPTRQ